MMDNQMTVGFKNRHSWLIAFGVAEIVAVCGLLFIGGVILFVAPRFIAEGIASGRLPYTPTRFFVLPAVAIVGLGVLFLSGGIGSVRCLNWSRILMMTVSTIWLGIGELVGGFVLLRVYVHGLPPSYLLAFNLFLVDLVVLMLGLPAVFAFFYSRRSVKATCLRKHALSHAG